MIASMPLLSTVRSALPPTRRRSRSLSGRYEPPALPRDFIGYSGFPEIYIHRRLKELCVTDTRTT